MDNHKCKNCKHGEDCHAPKDCGGCAVIYKYYRNKVDKIDNPINYELRSCLCKEFV